MKKLDLIRMVLILLVLESSYFTSIAQNTMVVDGGTHQTFNDTKRFKVKYNPAVFGGNTFVTTRISIADNISDYSVSVTSAIPSIPDPPINQLFADVVIFDSWMFNIDVTKTGTGTPDPCDFIQVNFKVCGPGVNCNLPNSSLVTSVFLRFKDLEVLSDKNALMGCNGLSFTASGICPTNPPVMELSIQEATLDPMTLDYTIVPNTEVKRQLTTSEISSMVNTSLDIFSFASPTSNPSSMLVQSNKYYVATMVDKGLGNLWIPTYHYFHTKPGTHDYAMRDFAADIGEEPSDKWEDGIFKSPDLWNNVPAIGGDPNDHNDPDFVTFPATQGNMMRFNMKNIGCNTNPPSKDHTLRLFWTRARSDELWDEHWIYSKAKVDHPTDPTKPKVVGGSEITIDPATGPYSDASQPIDLQNIGPNTDYLSVVGQTLTEREWFPPNPSLYNVTNGQMSNAGNRPVICFLAVINDKNNADDPLTWEPTTGVSALPKVPVYHFTKNNNNVVTRNSILMDNQQYLVDHGGGAWGHGFGTVLVNNDQPTARPITLCVDLDDIGLPADFRNYGRIEVGVTNGLWNNWVSSGMNQENMTVISPTLFELTDVHGCIEDILVYPESNEQIGLRFVYDGNATLPSVEENYEYILSATYGEAARGTNSVFQARVPTQSPLNVQNKRSVDIEKIDQKDLELIVYPNPAKDQFLISVSLPLLSAYTISITDAFGKQIEVIEGTNATKYFSHKVDMKNNRAGIYYIILQNGDVVQQKRVVLVK